MTTTTTNSVYSHATDADARIWIAELHTMFTTCGLVQTADTGQITVGSYTRPGGTNTTNGYTIWRLPDSSLYYKFQYGNGAATTTPRLDAQVGEGSNGSGTLTGQTSTNVIITSGQAIQSTTTAYASFVCVTNDFIGICWKVGSSTASGFANIAWASYKTVDTAGAVTSKGYVSMLMTTGAALGQSQMQCVRRTATAATYTASGSFCLVPGWTASTPANSLDANAKIQVYTHWGIFPEPAALLHTCTVRTAEIAGLNKFTVAMIGATPHTYLFIGNFCNNGHASSTTDNLWRCAMLWE